MNTNGCLWWCFVLPSGTASHLAWAYFVILGFLWINMWWLCFFSIEFMRMWGFYRESTVSGLVIKLKCLNGWIKWKVMSRKGWEDAYSYQKYPGIGGSNLEHDSESKWNLTQANSISTSIKYQNITDDHSPNHGSWWFIHATERPQLNQQPWHQTVQPAPYPPDPKFFINRPKANSCLKHLIIKQFLNVVPSASINWDFSFLFLHFSLEKNSKWITGDVPSGSNWHVIGWIESILRCVC